MIHSYTTFLKVNNLKFAKQGIKYKGLNAASVVVCGEVSGVTGAKPSATLESKITFVTLPQQSTVLVKQLSLV